MFVSMNGSKVIFTKKKQLPYKLIQIISKVIWKTKILENGDSNQQAFFHSKQIIATTRNTKRKKKKLTVKKNI